MAQLVREAMSDDGTRERIKEWLYDALENAGWAAALERHMKARDGTREKSSRVAEIVDSVAPKAFDSVPAEVRDRLCRELLAEVRAFQADNGGAKK